MPHPAASRRFPTLDQAAARHITQALGLANGKVQGPGGAAELRGLNPAPRVTACALRE